MLDEILAYLKNYFVIDTLYGKFVIEDGIIRYADGKPLVIANMQYFRVVNSMYNDGVYRYYKDTPIDFVQDEEFSGAIWRLAIPQDVIALADDVSAWVKKYSAADAPALSPFTSESFGGYSYSKSTPVGSQCSWQNAFSNRLDRYRKI